MSLRDAQIAWDGADMMRGRSAILKSLRITPDEPTAPYATFPFRILHDDGTKYIAGAIGCPRVFSLVDDIWSPDDISEVILWNPRSNELRAMSEAKSQPVFIEPETSWGHDTLRVYSDGYSFFRAWAENRSIWLTQYQASLTDPSRIRPTEPMDSHTPGALVIGDIDRVRLPVMVATKIETVSLDPNAFKRAMFRSLNIPRVHSYFQDAA